MAAINVDECFEFAGKQLSWSVVQIKDGNLFPRYTREDGTWVTVDSHAWSSGFFAGCLWFMYEYTGEVTGTIPCAGSAAIPPGREDRDRRFKDRTVAEFSNTPHGRNLPIRRRIHHLSGAITIF